MAKRYFASSRTWLCLKISAYRATGTKTFWLHIKIALGGRFRRDINTNTLNWKRLLFGCFYHINWRQWGFGICRYTSKNSDFALQRWWWLHERCSDRNWWKLCKWLLPKPFPFLRSYQPNWHLGWLSPTWRRHRQSRSNSFAALYVYNCLEKMVPIIGSGFQIP